MSEAHVKYLLRFPPTLHQRLTKRAKRHNRSLHAEILWILGRTLAADEKPAQPSPVEDGV